ncbi:MAG: DUF1648 domain-containing protein [Acidobacteria bacterium]|nr:DUF1648 domain-containing protein [Acidobacteriota bacterium]
MSRQDKGTPSFRILSGLLWLCLPAEAVLCAVGWHQLPLRLATHFNVDNQPNGWMPRSAWLSISLSITTLSTITATWILGRIKKPDPTSWGLLGMFYVVLGTLVWATDSVIGFNTRARAINITPVVAASMVTAILVVGLTLTTGRGAKLSAVTILADEIHQSMRWGFFFAALSAAFLALAWQVPMVGLRLGLALAIVLMLAAAALAWSGFHYVFTADGVEIRTLGFRLRSIPARFIRSYRIESWSAVGGYGIRALGNRRAYVWGNRGVRLDTTEGEVFLGHRQPERIIRNLDRVVSQCAVDHNQSLC